MREKAENVLLIVLDTVRAKSTSIAGHDITPTIADLGETGTLFEHAITPAPWTLPAHASMFTGLYPTEHSVTCPDHRLPPDFNTLGRQLQDAGFATGLFTPNMFLTEFYGMDQGFDESVYVEQEANLLFDDAFDPIEYVNRREQDTSGTRFKGLLNELGRGEVLKNVANATYYKIQQKFRQLSQTPGAATPEWDKHSVELATKFITEHAETDGFFVTVNLVGAHAPWYYDPKVIELIGIQPDKIAPPRRWKEIARRSSDQWAYAAGELEFEETDREILETLYEAWICQVDSLASRLVNVLERTGVREETLVIITADHGERVARDGVLGHTYTLHEEVTHVPLVMSGATVPETAVEEPVSLKDLYGTILRRTGAGNDGPDLLDEQAQGEALSEMAGAKPERIAQIHGEQYRSVAKKFDHRRVLVTDDGRAERRYGTGQVNGDPEIVNRLDELVDQLKPATQGREDLQVPLSDSVEKRLKNLGYR